MRNELFHLCYCQRSCFFCDTKTRDIINGDGGSAMRSSHRSPSHPKHIAKFNMTSSKILAAAYQQMAQIEKAWGDSSEGKTGKPLRITTHWYKPAVDDDGTNRVVMVEGRPKRPSVDSKQDRGEPYSNTLKVVKASRSNRRATRSEKQTRKPSRSKGVSGSMPQAENINLEGRKLSQESVKPSKRSRPHRHKQPPKATDPTSKVQVSQPTPTFREVHWSQLPHRENPLKANMTAKRQPSITIATPSDRPRDTPGFRPRVKPKADANIIWDVQNDATTLKYRPTRPRSPSRVRVRPQGKPVASSASSDETAVLPIRRLKRHPKPLSRPIHGPNSRPPLSPIQEEGVDVPRKQKQRKRSSSDQQGSHKPYQQQQQGPQTYHPRGYAQQGRRVQPVYGQAWRVVCAPSTWGNGRADRYVNPS